MSDIVSVSLEEEMKKNPELKKSDIKYLKEWKKKQPHLPKISDSSLALFLHSNYYLIEPTKNTIDNYYTLKTHIPEFFTDRDPLGNKDLREEFTYTPILPLEQKTRDGYNVLFVHIGYPDASKLIVSRFSMFAFMVLDLWIYHSGSTKGHIVIFDVQNVTFGYVARCNPVVIKKFFFFLQEALPVRLKGLHFLNVTPGMEAILKVVKPLLKKELMENLQVYNSVEKLDKFVPIEGLPNEYGGKAGPLMELHEAQIKELEKHRDWFFQEESNGKVDEKKRQGKGKSVSEIFGVEGSFKKLDID